MTRFTLVAIMMAAFLSFAFATEVAPSIPAVETWQEIPAPKPFYESEKTFFTKWHLDPRFDNYVGVTSYAGGRLILRGWGMINPNLPGNRSSYLEVRVAVLLENGEWAVGQFGERPIINFYTDADGT